MFNLRNLRESDEAMVLKWRNSPQVAPYMLRDTPITEIEHHKWFSKAKNDSPVSIIRILEDEEQPLGLVSLTNIDREELSCDWGGYLAPTISRGSGLGKALIYMSINLAIEEFDIEVFKVEVIVGNDNAIRLYESCGFEYKQLIKHRFIRPSGPVDVLEYSLNRLQWISARDAIKKRLIDLDLFG